MKRVILLTMLSIFLAKHVVSQNIKVNQLGLYSTAKKYAVVPGSVSGSYTVVDNVSGTTVFTGTLPAAQTWTPSGESIKIADFSSFTTVGTYVVKAGAETSYPFEIKGAYVYSDLLKWTTKGFYFWRASSAIESQYAVYNGIDYKRNAGHLDASVEIHTSAATAQRPAGTKVSAPKGWYDAGDYNLYVVNAGISVFSLIHAYEMCPSIFDNLNLNIPESNNTVPDFVDELKWEFDWLLAMQDLDGGVYFKLTSKSFDAFEMPEKDLSARYMVGKSTTSALDFAAMTAMGYRLFKKFEAQFPGFADRCLTASESAWTWAKANPSIAFSNPSDIYTGGYGDNSFSDEFFWAAAELYISTGNQLYYNELNFGLTFQSPTWGMVNGQGLMSLMVHLNNLSSAANKTTIQNTYKTLCDNVLSIYTNSVYKCLISNFVWGSNGDIAARGMVLAGAYTFLNDQKYLDAAMEGLNYILGRNATGYCFVTGFGDKSPLDIHDRRSGADGIVNPIPGYVVGGPNTASRSDCGASTYPSTYAARSYRDAQCSYSTNEIAINWNAPLVSLISMIEYHNNQQVPYVSQLINLAQGWNLISTNVHPSDSSISTIFASKPVEEIKTIDKFWKNGQATYLNGLNTVTAGAGYLVKMSASSSVTITGRQMSVPTSKINAKTGYFLVGCPYQSATSIPTLFNTTTVESIKNFDGFWKSDGTGTLNNLIPGNGYYVLGK